MAIESQFVMTFVAGFGVGGLVVIFFRYVFDHA